MNFVLLSTNILESVIDSKIEYLLNYINTVVLPMSYVTVQLSTCFRNCMGWVGATGEYNCIL